MTQWEPDFYTLKNGLSVILSKNTKEPRVAVRIAVRTGSNNDPKDHTGLAHYLEHLLFKGTDKYGSLNWEKEKPLLDRIENLYEQYNSTKDETKRKEIYKEIDGVSGEAAKFAIAGEYDKMMKAIGAQRTNAHTW
jgi:predicted Zn-dependent peptidase